MNLSDWFASEAGRDHILIFEGVEPKDWLNDLFQKHDHGSRIVVNRASLAQGSDARDVVTPVIEAYSKGLRSLLVIAPVWGTSEHTFDWHFVTDHVNLSGENPLRGGPLIEGKPWFTPMGEAYRGSVERLLRPHFELRGTVLSGVLAGLSGPTHPTAAEKKVLAAWGCAAYSWYIVTASIAAAHLGMTFMAIGWNGDRETTLHSLLQLSA